MVRVIVAGCCMALLVLGMALPAPGAAQSSVNPQLVTQTIVPGSTKVSHPGIAVANGVVGIAGNVNDIEARYWEKADGATSIDPGLTLASSTINGAITATVVDIAANGTVTYVWVDALKGSTIFLRQKPPGGTFGPTYTVVSPVPGTPGGRCNDVGAFNIPTPRSYPDVAVTADGRIFVVWSQDTCFRYRFSSDGGASWSPTYNFVDAQGLPLAAEGAPFVVAGPDNRVAAAFGDNINHSIYAALWQNGAFVIEPVTGVSEEDDFDPTIAFGPTGDLYVGFRRIGGGIYYAQRAGAGSWPLVKVADDKGNCFVNVNLDLAGNLAVTWTSASAGRNDVYFRYRPAGGAFADPVRATDSKGEFFCAQAATNLSIGATLTHVVARFYGSNDLETKYLLFSAVGAGATAAQPTLEQGAASVGNRTSVSVGFSPVAGGPGEVRWRWGAPPSDSLSDSGGWQPFLNPLSVPIPSSVNTSDCLPETLYTQVRGPLGIELTPRQDQILIDNSVGGVVQAHNPAAPGGDPDYTRTPAFALQINALNECSGLQDIQIGAPPDQFGPARTISNDSLSEVVPFANAATAQPGANTILLRLRDRVGNVVTHTRVLTYDTVRPTLVSGSFTLSSPRPDTTVLAALTFSNVAVQDDFFPGGYWGVQLANSTTPVSNPAESAQLQWRALPVRGGGAAPTIPIWNLAAGLDPATLKPGPFYVYLRFLDGASNPTDQVISATITLDRITLPAARLPVVLR